jgi:hypothetical protein
LSAAHKSYEIVADVENVEALAVQVGQFFHLKRAFVGNCLTKPLTQKHYCFAFAKGRGDVPAECCASV